MSNHDQAALDSVLSSPCRSLQPVSGGDIHRSYLIDQMDGKRVFAKLNDPINASVLASEYESLKRLNNLLDGFYPTPIKFETSHGIAVLLMDAHTMRGFDQSSSKLLGKLLAEQHKITHSVYGWPVDNFIGRNLQRNTQSESWVDFFCHHRLAPQLELVAGQGLDLPVIKRIESLMTNLDDFIDEQTITPALLHGDLWSGNAALDANSKRPILFDPAPYFGDREADLAMTRLFSGFQADFYRSYHKIFPTRAGHDERRKIYNLYHSLNHVNLFGCTYSGLVEECLKLNV